MRIFLFIILMIPGVFVFSQTDSLQKSHDLAGLAFRKNKSEFRFNGTYRLRGEYQGKYNTKIYGTGEHETFLLSRLRLNLDYRYAGWLKLFAELQDARVAGSSFPDSVFRDKNNPFHDPFDINKLYLSVRPLDSLWLTIGRQALNIANRRVFGPGDWGNTGRYIWDAIHVNYANAFFTSQAVFGYNIMHQPDVFPNRNREGTWAFALYNSIQKLPFGLDVFYVYKFDKNGNYASEISQSGNLYTHYIGSRFQKSYKAFDLLFLGTYQFGKYAVDPISAFGLVGQLQYTFESFWNARIGLTYIYGSGDSDPSDGRNQTFDGVFSGSDTDLYSWMNFSFWKNTHQPKFELLLRPLKKFSLQTEYHLFFLDEPSDAWYFPGKSMRRDLQGISGNFVGQEVDIIAQVKLFKWFHFRGGYCIFLPGEFVENTGEYPFAQWTFGELTFYF